MQDLGTLGGTESHGYGINFSGQVTGYARTVGNADHAFLYSSGTMQDLGTLGGTSSVGWGINASGQITGDATTVGNAADHAFLYDGVRMIDLNTLIDPLSGWELQRGEGINDVGQITGYGTINGQTHAFLLTPSGVPEIDPATGSSALSLVAGVLAMVEQRRQRGLKAD